MSGRTDTDQLEIGVDAMVEAQKWRDPRWGDSAIGGFQYERDGKPWFVIRDHEAEREQEDTVILLGTFSEADFNREFPRAVHRRLLRKALAAMDAEERG
ncbi:hypothetical protein AD929_15860 [Gluconobacter potus]|uniref:Uncharacterized protein n=1 Tax=Gluconobacter potus TaxID=2724927 RepID=A0A149QPM6_9PROT|nr:hypothetical protein [Gluconobacter potus]KXU99267.1 hypothetical protein AD929_15860 [Gluconobacter potus]